MVARHGEVRQRFERAGHAGSLGRAPSIWLLSYETARDELAYEVLDVGLDSLPRCVVLGCDDLRRIFKRISVLEKLNDSGSNLVQRVYRGRWPN